MRFRCFFVAWERPQEERHGEFSAMRLAQQAFGNSPRPMKPRSRVLVQDRHLRNQRARPHSQRPAASGLSMDLTSQHGGGGKGPSRQIYTSGDAGDGGVPTARGLWAMYLEFLDSHPVLSRALTRGVVAGLGNLGCQLLVEKGELDLYRLSMYATMGFALIGPTLYFWYTLLAKLLPGTGLTSILASVALDQLMFQPPWISVLMTTVATFEGKLGFLWPKLQQDWAPTVQVSWMIWIPAQLINFKFVPLRLRVTYDTAVAVLWHVYLSYQSHKVVQSLAVK